MTDLLAPPDGDISPHPVADAMKVCPECGESFDGPAWHLQRGLHRKRAHGVAGVGRRQPKTTRTRAPRQPKAPKPIDGEEAPSEPKPSRPVRRVDASDMLSRAWAWLGRRVEQAVMVPTGRALQLESPVAGIVLDDMIKGTRFDRPVQWAARKEAAGRQAGALFLLPALVHMGAMNNGQALPTVAPWIEDALLSLGPSVAKAVKKQERRRKDLADMLAGMGDALGMPEGQAPTIEDVFGWLYPPQETTDGN